jgi:predicted ATPase/DNA-binding NarL/FixJ family response regulator
MTAIRQIAETTLFGRDAEIARMCDLLDSVEHGETELLLVSGEPGIGKTRLLEELSDEAEARRFLVLSGRGTELEQEAPFAPLIEALDGELAALGTERLESLRERLPDLIGVLPSIGRGAPVPAGSASERFRHHRAIRALLEELAVDEPLLLILDDVHWADTASIEAISHLLRHPPEAPVLIALAHRPTTMPASLTALLDAAPRERHVTELQLSTLTEEQAAGLLSAAPAEAWAEIFEESGGNPFYIEQLLRAQTRGRARQRAREPSGIEVPRAIVAAINQELRQLPDEVRRLLGGAAVAGEPFDTELARAAAGVLPDRTYELLDELVERDLVHVQSDPRQFRFRHPLVRRAVYDSLSPGQRLAMHQRAAMTLEQIGAPSPAVAHHLAICAAPGDERAVAVLACAAADVAGAAPTTAAEWLTRALALLPQGREQQRLGLLTSLAQSQSAAGALAEAHSTLTEIVDALEGQDECAWTQAVAALASVELALGRQSGMRQRIESAFEAMPDRRAISATPLLVVSALDAAFLGDFPRAERDANALLEGGEGSAVPQTLAHALMALVLQLQADGRTAEAVRHLNAAKTLFDRLSDAELAATLDLPWLLGLAEFQLEQFEDCVRHTRRGVSIALEFADAQHLAQTRAFLSYSLLYLGRVEEARQTAAEALEAGRLMRVAAYSAWTVVVAAMTESCEDHRRALRLCDEAQSMVADLDESMVFDTTHGHIGLICADASEYERCIDHMRVAGAPEFARFGDAGRRSIWMEALTRSTLALGRHEQAREWAARIESLTVRVDLPVARGVSRRAQALVTLDGGDAGAAAELALAGAALADTRGARLDAGRSRIVAGRALVAAGQRARGIELLHETREDLAACGARRLAQEAARELRIAGASAPAPVARRAGDLGTVLLSKREREIAALVVAGNSNPQIAQVLYLSRKTVEGHMSRIFGKLGVSSRAEVAARVAVAAAELP